MGRERVRGLHFGFLGLFLVCATITRMYPLDAETILEIQRERQRWTVNLPHVNGWYWLRGWKEALLSATLHPPPRKRAPVRQVGPG